MRALKVALCVGSVVSCLYGYLCLQNEITKRRLNIPLLSKEIREIQEKNTCLRYKIEQFESPEHLMALASRKEYAHLKQPWLKDVLALQQSPSLDTSDKMPAVGRLVPSHSVVVGTKNLSK